MYIFNYENEFKNPKRLKNVETLEELAEEEG